jgi:hypothetical protein
MRNPRSIVEVHNRLAVPAAETVESLRLLRSFMKLTPRQQRDIVELVERLAIDHSLAPDRPQA